MATTKPTYVDENGNVYTMLGNIRGPAGKDGINGKSIYANTVDPWSVSGWNPVVAGDLFLNTTTGILWSAKAGAVTSNVQSNWTKVGELAGKITVDSALSSTSTNPVQNKVIKSALDGKADKNHNHSSLINSSGCYFNAPSGGSGGEQRTLATTKDLEAYQPAGNYAASSHNHDDRYYTETEINNKLNTINTNISDIQDDINDNVKRPIDELQSGIATKADINHTHDDRYYTESEIDTKLSSKSDTNHTHSQYIDKTTENQEITSIKRFTKSPVYRGSGGGYKVEDEDGLYYTEYKNGVIHYYQEDYDDGSITYNCKYFLPFPSDATSETPKEIHLATTDIATSSTAGLVKSSNTGTTANRDYKVQVNSDGTMKVNVPWTDTNTTYSAATQSANGLMSSSDKKKLDGIADGANKITVDNALSSSSTNPVQNTVINSALQGVYSDMNSMGTAIDGKADADHTHDYLPLAGGTMTGSLSLKEYKNILLRPNNSSYTSGIGYDTYGNECIALWAKNSVTRLRWNAGVDMSELTSGKMMTITPDFEISKASGTAKGYIAGQEIIHNGNIGSQSVNEANFYKYGRGVTIANSTSFTNNFNKDIFGEENNNHYHLVEVRTNSNAPSSLLGDYASGIAWKGSDTYGSLMVSYNSPNIRVSGGNGANTNPKWTVDLVHSGNIGSQSVNYATTSHFLRTYSASNSSHGTDYLLKCRHNVDGNGRFKLQIIRTDGTVTHSTSVDYANSAGSVAWGNVSGKPSSYTPSSHTHSYLPLSGGTMTGAISYQGTKATYPMINWIDNTADTYGNGIRIGGGGATIIGGGESASLPSVSGGDEILYLMNDAAIDFYSNCQEGLNSAKHMTFDKYGTLNVPTDVKVNGNSVIHSGNIGSQSVNYANTAGSAKASNISMSSDGTTLTITYS